MEALLQLDGNFLLWIQDYIRNESMNGFWTLITSLGDSGWFWIALSLALCIFPKTRKAGVLALCSLALCALITNVCLKNLVARPRPYTQIPGLEILINPPKDWSFPSGHTTASFAAACSYLWGLPRKCWSLPALALASLIAFSRLYIGVHYPSDILSGLLIGITGSWIVYCLYQRKTERHLPER